MSTFSFRFFPPAALAVLAVALAASPSRAAPDPHSGDQVTFFSDNSVGADETVDGNAVAIFGDLTINGTVHGQSIVVWGDLTLGPTAQVDGDVTCVAGKLRKSADAQVGGRVLGRGIGALVHALPSWRTVFFGGIRSVAVWLFGLSILCLYALLALVFPGGIRRCGDTLVERPGLSVLSAILGLLALPVLFILLLTTIIGIPLAIIVLPLAVIGLMMFGKAAFYGLIGRAVFRDPMPVPAAVFGGGLICLLFFQIPLVGVLLSVLLSVLMFGCALVALSPAGKKPASTSGPAENGAAGRAGPREAEGAPSVVPPPSASASIPPLIPVEIESATLRRAGFWIRAVALLIDSLLVVAVFHIFGPFVFILLCGYGAIMWKLKSTTVGGIIFGLKVVRLDGRPIEWDTAVARAAGCFLSLISFGLGFIWVVFDGERQSWHDKIAGTTVVHAPKGASLV